MIRYIQFAISILVLNLVFIGLVNANTFDETSVRNFIKELNNSIRLRDYKSFLTHYSESASFINDLPEELGGRSHFSMVEYRELVKDSFNVPAKVVFDIKVKNVQISSDNKKVYVDTLTHQQIFKDGVVVQDITLDQKISIVRINGELKIVETIARTYNDDN